MPRRVMGSNLGGRLRPAPDERPDHEGDQGQHEDDAESAENQELGETDHASTLPDRPG